MARKPLVLIVDDEPDLVASLEYALQREGFEVFEASTGLEAGAPETAPGRSREPAPHRRPTSCCWT